MIHRSRKVLVTGASGFLGQHLVARLSVDHQVIAVVRSVSRAKPSGLIQRLENKEPTPAQLNNISVVGCDLVDASAVQQLIDQCRPDWLFHLAGYAEGLPDLEHVLPSFAGDLQTTVNVLTASVGKVSERVVITGSLEEPDQDSSASSPYAIAKYAGVKYAETFRDLYGLPVSIARIFMAYGPGQRTRKLIPHVISNLLMGTAPQLGDGERQVDWIYVDDVIRGLMACAQESNAIGAPLDLGSGCLISIREVVRLLVELTGSTVQPEFGSQPTRRFERVRVADVAATQARLNWTPQIDLRTGLQRSIDAMRSMQCAPF